ncbi:hypothetical protein HDU92_006047 [Lobulomyces angularis]|nr:hypothetical protein HDU92_006047 [Lobulomyces angularis]
MGNQICIGFDEQKPEHSQAKKIDNLKSNMKIFVGPILHSFSPSDLRILNPGTIAVNNLGKIEFVQEGVHSDQLLKKFNLTSEHVTVLKENQFILPGFVDTHIHAPQYVFTGTGYDVGLLEWLEKYTFPKESEFKDSSHAHGSYQKVVKRSLRCGTTTACYYATIHLEASKILANVVKSVGQRGFIGKVNMDNNSPDYYVEKTEDSLNDTSAFIEYVNSLNSDLVKPVLTPRFAPSCTSKLMSGLADISREKNLLIQTHISENCGECEWVKNLFPEQNGYADVYKHNGLLNEKSVMAHCIYLTEEERKLFKEVNAGISHCPNSNFSLQSGVLNVRQLFREGITKVGLGTDVSGGYSASLLDGMRQSIIASKVIHMKSRDAAEENICEPLTFKEAIYLATLGGAKVLNLEEKIGNFEVGKSFDALLIDLNVGENGTSTIDVFRHDKIEDLIEKFVYLGDDRNISQIFVAGKQVV